MVVILTNCPLKHPLTRSPVCHCALLTNFFLPLPAQHHICSGFYFGWCNSLCCNFIYPLPCCVVALTASIWISISPGRDGSRLSLAASPSRQPAFLHTLFVASPGSTFSICRAWDLSHSPCFGLSSPLYSSSSPSLLSVFSSHLWSDTYLSQLVPPASYQRDSNSNGHTGWLVPLLLAQTTSP